MPFDPSEGAASDVLDALIAGPAAALTAVAVVVAPQVRASGWGADVAVALARRWSGPRRVILVDLDLDRPVLHERLGLANDEGVIDVVEYGISPALVLRTVPGERFDFMAAGAFTASAGDVLRHESWSRLMIDAAAQRATLLAVVPADADGVDAVIERAGAVLVVAEADEAEAVVGRLSHPYAVLAVLTPPAPDRPAPAAPAPSTRLTDEEFERIRLPKDRAARESLIADLRDRQRTARLDHHVPAGPTTAGAAAAAAAADPPAQPDGVDGVDGATSSVPQPSPEPPASPVSPASPVAPVSTHVPAGADDVAREMRVETAGDDVDIDQLDADDLDTMEPHVAGGPRRPPRRPRYAHPIGWTVMIVLMASLLAGAWRFLSNRSAETAAAGAAAADSSADAVVDPDSGAVALGPGEAALPFAVAIEAHRDAVTAADRVEALTTAEPGTPFHVAPLEREGVLFYHVMAGPLPDSAAALALRDTLIARGHKTGSTPTDVRSAPFAYAVGEHSSAAFADEQLRELRQLNVPGYMITTGAVGQPPRYRVYVGGFATESEADVVGQLLRAAGVRDSLVTRTGSIIQ